MSTGVIGGVIIIIVSLPCESILKSRHLAQGVCQVNRSKAKGDVIDKIQRGTDYL